MAAPAHECWSGLSTSSSSSAFPAGAAAPQGTVVTMRNFPKDWSAPGADPAPRIRNLLSRFGELLTSPVVRRSTSTGATSAIATFADAEMARKAVKTLLGLDMRSAQRSSWQGSDLRRRKSASGSLCSSSQQRQTLQRPPPRQRMAQQPAAPDDEVRRREVCATPGRLRLSSMGYHQSPRSLASKCAASRLAGETHSCGSSSWPLADPHRYACCRTTMARTVPHA